MQKNLTFHLTLVEFIAVFLIVGCSHTYVLDKESPVEFIELINKKAKNKKGVIQTKDGKKYNAKAIEVTVNSTSWLEPKTNSYKKRANSELNDIVIKDHGKGAVEGLGVGFLSGFAGGFVLGYLASSEHAYFGRAGSATITGTVLGLLGGFFGLIGGSASGDQEIFMFHASGLTPKYYIIKDVQILNETESTIQIKWQEKLVWLDKAEVTIEKTDEGIDIRIPERLYKEKFLR